MRRLIESTFVTLGGDIAAPQEWGPPYLFGPDGGELSRELLFGAGALLLGRKTYEGLSAAYTAMAAGEPDPETNFVDRMNAIPKYVASTTLHDIGWNATILGADVARKVGELKNEPGGYLLKYGTGPLDRVLVEHGLIDEFRIWVVPVTTGPGQRLFEDLPATALTLTGTQTLASGVVILTYSLSAGPGRSGASPGRPR
jgi:dihydrofolate reductase